MLFGALTIVHNLMADASENKENLSSALNVLTQGGGGTQAFL